MSWLKDVILDILVLVVIAVYAVSPADWGYWIIAIYTPLMVVLKLVALSSGVSMAAKSRASGGAPAWFFHVIYAASVVLLLYAQWYLAAAGWAVIWLLSAIAESRNSSPTKST